MDVMGALRRWRIIGGVRSSHTEPDITL